MATTPTPLNTTSSALTPPTSPTPYPIQNTQLTQADLQQQGLPLLNSLFAQVFDQISTLNGSKGQTPLPSGINVAGATVSGIGEPQTATDAVSKGHAEQNYSAAALAPQLEAGQKTTLKTYRALNSKQQRENYSNFLEGVLNTAPTANSSTVSADAPSGGSVTVTISAGTHLFVSGNQVTYAQRSDTLTLPTTFTITAISRAGGVVSATTSAASGLTTGDTISVTGVTDSTFDGTFVLTGGSGTLLTWAQAGATATSSGGTAGTNSCYYYYLAVNTRTLALAGPFAADTQQFRTQVNIDGTVLISTVVLNGTGLDQTQSAAGATPPAATGNARILTRL